MLVKNLVWACGSMYSSVCSNKHGSLLERGCWRFLFCVQYSESANRLRAECGARAGRAGRPGPAGCLVLTAESQQITINPCVVGEQTQALLVLHQARSEHHGDLCKQGSDCSSPSHCHHCRVANSSEPADTSQ